MSIWQKYRGNIVYSEVFWMYWSAYGVVSSFSSVFLLGNGYTNTEIGVLIAIANLSSVILQPILAGIADKSRRISVGQIAIAVSFLIIIFQVFTAAVKGKSPILFGAYILMFALHASLQPLLNSLSGNFLKRGIVIDYGIGRGFGSLGYSIMTALLGVLVAAAGYKILPFAGIAAMAFTTAGLIYLDGMYRKGREHAGAGAIEETKDISMKDFLKRHKMFMVLAGGIFLMFYHNQVICFFLLQVFQKVGGNSSDMGVYYSLMSFLEIPAFIGFTWLNKRIKTSWLLKIGVLGLVLRAILMYLASSPLGIQLSLIVNPFGFPLFLAAIVKYINEIMGDGEKVRGQSMYVMVVTASSVVASFTGGMVIDTMGAKTLLLISLVTCIIGALVSVLMLDKAKQESENLKQKIRCKIP